MTPAAPSTGQVPSASAGPEPSVPASLTAPPPKDELVRATIYILSADDDWFDAIAHAARARRPRVDASRSAVTRLALARLREELSTEELVNILQSRAQDSDQVSGRKRL